MVSDKVESFHYTFLCQVLRLFVSPLCICIMCNLCVHALYTLQSTHLRGWIAYGNYNILQSYLDSF